MESHQLTRNTGIMGVVSPTKETNVSRVLQSIATIEHFKTDSAYHGGCSKGIAHYGNYASLIKVQMQKGFSTISRVSRCIESKAQR